MNRVRPWLLLALTLIPLAVVAVRWAGGSRSSGSAPGLSPAPSQAGQTPRARNPGSPASPSAGVATAEARIAGRVLGGEELELGRVELRCEHEEGRAWVQLDADGGFVGQLCARSTCVRIVHPHLVQREAWVIAAGEASNARVDSAQVLEGRVEDERGRGIAAAELLLSTADGRRFAAQTDIDGDFALALPALRPCDPCDEERGPPRCSSASKEGSLASGRLLATAPGHASIGIELPRSTTEITIQLPPPAAALEGIVVGMGGQAFTSRLQVLATNIEDEQERHAAVVDEQGRFSFRSLSRARYRVRVLRDGLELAHAQALSPGEFVELHAERGARGRDLELQLLDGSGDPVSAAQVDGGPFRSARSDVSGRLHAVDVLPGDYSLRIRSPACPVERFELHMPGFGSDSDAEAHMAQIRLESDCESRGAISDP